ncbi:MBL fold metallo-hydrolase [Thermococcus gammatolerans]|uniref:mRNA 3-end processing factor, putative n=1 Tax=Thermococcus gammatolerans (strain DSM 15229 / JCM 11827 / EJ3) TaxID=593117 RepID=C5A7H7_THEGJ|nr:MBL fold metallo-hydrolase [Thermococcus gammatolerans]ACS34189.1 mRNA 3-end processing factor, putative [Thermococcus gammatolerans EJ3]
MLVKGIGLDSSAKLAFQSHAHSDHFVSGEVIFATRATKFLSHLRKGGFYREVKFRKTFYIGDVKAKLYPAGHMLGSAGIKLWLEAGTLFYTGDTKWFKLRTAEKSRFPRADFLVIEATFGVPAFAFPSPREAEKKLISFVEEALDRGKKPVLYVNQMGKAQEVMKILDVHGITVRPSREMLKVARVYSKFGVRFDNIERDGEVILRSYRSPKVENSLSPWELTVSGFGRLKLSNHADFWELVRIVEKVKPEKVFTVYGFAREFAEILRGLGHEAFPLLPNSEIKV